ncbi:MAG: methyl coenzyme M reductase system, component A2 [Candidatus Helarchaeota archaeon]
MKNKDMIYVEDLEDFIIVKGLFKEFERGAPAYQDINFVIKEGRSFGILGKSGSGKSALMHALRGTPEYRPTKGEVIYRISVCSNQNCLHINYPSLADKNCPKCGEKLAFKKLNFWDEASKNSPVFRALYNRISIMLQRTFALFGELPVLENIKDALERAKVPERRRDGKAASLLTKVKMGHRALHIARDLSGGEKQRVVFAMALAKDPLIFLADEPTGTLDVLTSAAIHKVMNNAVKKDRMTLIVTSHWPHAVEELSEEAILLEDGRIVMADRANIVAQHFMSKVKMIKAKERTFGNPLISVKNCVKWYYTFDRGIIKAVDGVNLDIYENEIFGLVGLSGSGKTSLAHMMAGLKTITKGQIFVKVGDDWIDMSIPGPGERGRATRYMGVLHQEYALYPHRTVLENLTGAIEYAIPEELKTNKAYEALKAVNFTNAEIENILYKFPDEISEGERHRVAIARILIKEPRICFLDEGTGTADPLTRMEIVRSIFSSREQLNQTYVIISHDIDFVLAACDRAALMKDGKILKLGKPEEVVQFFKEIESK